MLRLYPLLILAASSLIGCIALDPYEEDIHICGNIEYNPSYQICENDALKIKCGNDYYNPIKEFCSEQDNQIYNKCGVKNYNTERQICENAMVYDMCGSSKMNSYIEGCCNNTIFDLETHFCFYDDIHDKCGGKLYNPQYQMCEDGTMKMICGNEDVIYDPETQFCSENAVYDKCSGVEYNALEQICENDIILLKCEDEWYAPAFAYCAGDVVKNKETFIDNRDGEVYKYVTIGNQTWMAENLRYAASNTKCYGNNPDNCKIFGILYTWNAATAACPLGWHLPSDAEWHALKSFAGANGGNAAIKLKANSNLYDKYKGTDDFGFTALPGGYYRYGGSAFMHIREVAGFWSATTGSMSGSAHFHYMHEYRMDLDGFYVNDSWANVRCIKN